MNGSRWMTSISIRATTRTVRSMDGSAPTARRPDSGWSLRATSSGPVDPSNRTWLLMWARRPWQWVITLTLHRCRIDYSTTTTGLSSQILFPFSPSESGILHVARCSWVRIIREKIWSRDSKRGRDGRKCSGQSFSTAILPSTVMTTLLLSFGRMPNSRSIIQKL